MAYGDYLSGFMGPQDQRWTGGDAAYDAERPRTLGPENMSPNQDPWGQPGERAPSGSVDPDMNIVADWGTSVGHNGNYNGMTREGYRDAWMGSGARNMSNLESFLAKYGGQVVSGNGTVRTPFGEEIDMLINARGSAAGAGDASAGWGGVGGGASVTTPIAQRLATGTAPGGPAGGAAVALPQTASSTAAAQGYSENDPQVQDLMRAQPGWSVQQAIDWANKYYSQAPGAPAQPNPATPAAPAEPTPKEKLMAKLQERIDQSLEVDPNDPVIRNQADTFSAAAQRARRNYLGDAAEGRSPFATGAQRNEERMTAEKLGQNTAQFESELVGRELATRRQEIKDAMDSMGNLLTEQERQALQKELAELDASIRRHGIDTQNAQFYAGLSQSDKHFYDQLAQTGRLAELDNSFRYAQLGQNDSQFRDQMGFNYSDRNAYWDAVKRGLL